MACDMDKATMNACRYYGEMPPGDYVRMVRHGETGALIQALHLNAARAIEERDRDALTLRALLTSALAELQVACPDSPRIAALRRAVARRRRKHKVSTPTTPEEIKAAEEREKERKARKREWHIRKKAEQAA